jgi:hypothetical protein
MGMIADNPKENRKIPTIPMIPIIAKRFLMKFLKMIRPGLSNASSSYKLRVGI